MKTVAEVFSSVFDSRIAAANEEYRAYLQEVPLRLSQSRHMHFNAGILSAHCRGNTKPIDTLPVVLPFDCLWLESGDSEYAWKFGDAGFGVQGLLAWRFGGTYRIVAMEDNRELVFGEIPIGPHAGGWRGAEFDHECYLFFKVFTDVLRHQGAIFLEKTPARYKIGRGENRHLVRPKEIVRVVLKSERKAYERQLGHPIDWSHQWEVMGHWRRVVGTGKDLDGHYSVRGFTWVPPHRKGAADKGFVKKVRLVSDLRIQA